MKRFLLALLGPLLVLACAGAPAPSAASPGIDRILADVIRDVGTVSKFAQDAAKLAPVVADAIPRAEACAHEVKVDPVVAASTCFGLVQDLRAAGLPIPAEVSKAADYLGAIAAHDVEIGLRALYVEMPDAGAKD